MKLRDVLTAPALDEKAVEELKGLVNRIENSLEAGADDATTLIAEFNDRTGREYPAFAFRSYWEAMSLEHFVREALLKPPGQVSDITRDELVEILRRATPGQPDHSFETESFYRELFDDNVPHPSASSLICNPPDDAIDPATWTPSPEEIVDLALAYQPVVTAMPQAVGPMNEGERARIQRGFSKQPDDLRYRPATDEELLAFEREHGPLPPDFRWFLLQCGGGVVGGEWVNGIEQLAATHAKFEAEAGDEGWRMNGVFIIGWDGAGNPFGIDSRSGAILIEDHNVGDIRIVASSLTSFLLAGLDDA